MTVYFSLLLERAVLEPAARAALKLVYRAGQLGYRGIDIGYSMRVDRTRDLIVQAFRQMAKDPNDVLIMLDFDHTHPQNILEVLAAAPAQYGVVGALCHRRGDDYRPMFYIHSPEDTWDTPAEWPDNTLLECTMVGTGAISIKRWVFDQLEAQGLRPPFFRFDYENPNYPTEDWYFAHLCEQAGIPHYVDTGIMTPHISWRYITTNDWRGWVEANRDKLEEA